MNREPLRFLIVVAHPHDFTHGAATVGMHVDKGASATVVAVTDGIQAHNEKLEDEMKKPPELRDSDIVNQTVEQYAAEKTRELQEACALFGIGDVRSLGYPMPFRKERYRQAIEDIKQLILELRPHILITHSPYGKRARGHIDLNADDHTEVGLAVQEAYAYAGVTDPAKTQVNPPHRVAMILYPGVYFDKADVDFVVDIGEAGYERRMRAEEIFLSQGHTPAYARRTIELITGNLGWFSHVCYAEGWVRDRIEVHDEIPISDYTLRMATEPYSDLIRRMIPE